MSTPSFRARSREGRKGAAGSLRSIGVAMREKGGPGVNMRPHAGSTWGGVSGTLDRDDDAADTHDGAADVRGALRADPGAAGVGHGGDPGAWGAADDVAPWEASSARGAAPFA